LQVFLNLRDIVCIHIARWTGKTLAYWYMGALLIRQWVATGDMKMKSLSGLDRKDGCVVKAGEALQYFLA
jgi:hypothetical protein